MTKPYSIKIFLPGVDPDGLRTIERSNWSGTGIVFPRALMTKAKTKRELTRPGVCVLGEVLPEVLPYLTMIDGFVNRSAEILVGSLSLTIN
jgi:hypothetical protein